MKRILLVPSPNVVGRGISPYLPLGLFSIQAVSSQFQDTVDVLEFSSDMAQKTIADSHDLAEAILSGVDLSNYDTVGLSTMCNSFHHSLVIARHIKERNPEVAVWMGGPHASALASDILRVFAEVDAVFAGEAESTIAEILARRSRGLDGLAGVAGVHTRHGGYTPRPILGNLDRLPYIDTAGGFLGAVRRLSASRSPCTIPLEAERGCSGRCAFCSTRRFWGSRVRRKSDSRLIGEMRRLQGSVGVSTFDLIGDNFAAPRQRLLAFCDNIARCAADLRWVCCLRMDRILPSDLNPLWAGGCRGFFVGLESASQQTLDRIAKGVVLERELEVVRRAVAMGFLVQTSFIVGFPWETKEELDRTFELHCQMLELGVFRSCVMVLCLLPGTQFAEDPQYRVRFDRGRSGMAGDDLPLDDEVAKLIERHPRLFMQFGYLETDGVSWVDVSSVADASSQLAHAYFSRREHWSFPA